MKPARDGYNPLRWRCDERGCFNVKQRPKIEVFAHCLPGKIAFSDIDATVEVNGCFLFLEFKSGMPRDIPYGQKVYHQRLTAGRPNFKSIIVCADAETMECRALCVIANGKVGPWEITSRQALSERIAAWARHAKERGSIVP